MKPKQNEKCKNYTQPICRNHGSKEVEGGFLCERCNLS